MNEAFFQGGKYGMFRVVFKKQGCISNCRDNFILLVLQGFVLI